MVCEGEMGQKCSKSWTSPLVGVSRERAQWVSSVFLVLSWFLYSCLGRRSTGVTKNITSGSVTLPCWRIEERFNEIQSSLIFICIFSLLRHLNISENTSWRKGTAPLLKCCSLAFFFFFFILFTFFFNLMFHSGFWFGYSLYTLMFMHLFCFNFAHENQPPPSQLHGLSLFFAAFLLLINPKRDVWVLSQHLLPFCHMCLGWNIWFFYYYLLCTLYEWSVQTFVFVFICSAEKQHNSQQNHPWGLMVESVSTVTSGS